jgi:predicted O-linked N-acetylglucosamine transferase (SPINDLY family)
VDFIMTTRDLFPSEGANGYSEAPLYLPGAYLTVDPLAPHNAPCSRTQAGLPEAAFVYCALLNPFKLRPALFERWVHILGQVPGSVLWLVEENTTARKNLIEFAQARGLDASRLVFTPRITPADYRARLQLADLFLDTSPYGNGATAHDAVLANLPMLTRPGSTMMSRLTAHVMAHMRMQPLVVKDWHSYETTAIQLGNHPQLLAEAKQRMREARPSSALFDHLRFAREFGDTLRSGMEQLHPAHNLPTNFRTPQPSEVIS